MSDNITELAGERTQEILAVLKAAGWEPYQYDEVTYQLDIPVSDEDDGENTLERLNDIVKPFGISFGWSGFSNTDKDGDTTAEVVMCLD